MCFYEWLKVYAIWYDSFETLYCTVILNIYKHPCHTMLSPKQASPIMLPCRHYSNLGAQQEPSCMLKHPPQNMLPNK